MPHDTTREYYDTHASEYADQTWNISIPAIWRLLTERVPRGGTILDLGCGAGRDLKVFADSGYKVIGVDYSVGLLEIARRRSSQTAIWAEFHSLPFHDRCFDAVWAIASLLHVSPHEIPSVLREVRRVLNPSGSFIASMKQGTGEHADQSGRFFVHYKKEEWNRLLTDAGFNVEDIHETLERRMLPTGKLSSIDWLVSVATIQDDRASGDLPAAV